MSVNKNGYLVLENGSVFKGKLINRNIFSEGEVVFNTSAFGYEQILSDPSYAGQMVVMTYPLIGNYGLNFRLLESEKPWVRGFIARDIYDGAEHYEKQLELRDFIAQYNIACLVGVDTRAITRLIRSRGTMGGVITDSIADLDTIIKKAKSVLPPAGGYVKQVTRGSIERMGSGDKRVVLMDFGTKKSIYTSLIERECEVIVVPADTGAVTILEMNPDGIVLSNGPGDPVDCGYAVETVKNLIGTVPILGICLGHQLLALAFGGKTRKMAFGHRGANHPVKDMRTGKIYITSQNHGYVVDEHSLNKNQMEILFKNINDGTVEGMMHKELPVMSVQFHPEASPGPHDTHYIMDEFIDCLKTGRGFANLRQKQTS